MTVGNPAQRSSESGSRVPRSDSLPLRILSSVVLAPVTIAVAFIGGWPFVVFWTIAAIGVVHEWNRMIAVRSGSLIQAIGVAAFACAGLAMALGHVVWAGGLVAAGAVLVLARADEEERWWPAIGVVYAGAVLLAPTVLRRDDELGFFALLFLFAVVWATDSCGYFGGRLVGGPKLWVRVSPKKTWAGAISGALGAVAAGAAVGYVAQLPGLLPVAALALLMSAVSQAGDLFESAVKRRFGIKDAGQVIPGHGGIMDRVDGFVAAALVAAIIGLLKGGLAAPARGLLVWG